MTYDPERQALIDGARQRLEDAREYDRQPSVADTAIALGNITLLGSDEATVRLIALPGRSRPIRIRNSRLRSELREQSDDNSGEMNANG